MKYQYTSYDYSKILDLYVSKYSLKLLDKDYIIEKATFDKETNAIVLKLRCSNGVEEVLINVSSLISTEEYEKTKIQI
jgi:hypothetical protein